MYFTNIEKNNSKFNQLTEFYFAWQNDKKVIVREPKFL